MKKEYKFPEILQEILRENNMSQRKLADKLNLSSEAVHKWIRFKSVPQLFSLMAISEIFDVPLEYLVYGETK